MTDLDPLKDAEQILRTLEKEVLERLQVTERSADAPQMNSAVGRLTYIDATSNSRWHYTLDGSWNPSSPLFGPHYSVFRMAPTVNA